MEIPKTIIPTAYKISKKVYNSELTLTEGVNEICKNIEVNKNSVRDYINNFRYLMAGNKFSRTLNADSMEYYFANILHDYGISGLEKPLIALKKHIDYYEEMQKTTMHQMRFILNKYSECVKTPELIENVNELIYNLNTIETYLTDGDDDENKAVKTLLKKGICFVAYSLKKELRFAPSKFIGYKMNKLNKYSKVLLDGRETNKAINTIFKSKPIKNEKIDTAYLEYCLNLGIQPTENGGSFSVSRKYWILELEHDFINNLQIEGEFPEGKIVERIHKSRERNSKVIEIAKMNFKNKYGKLFCQVCGFDFEAKYGHTGKDFIEGHHTIPVSEMSEDYKTKPEEIAMLCSNCHKMIHKKRPWLTTSQLNKLLKNN